MYMSAIKVLDHLNLERAASVDNCSVIPERASETSLTHPPHQLCREHTPPVMDGLINSRCLTQPVQHVWGFFFVCLFVFAISLQQNRWLSAYDIFPKWSIFVISIEMNLISLVFLYDLIQRWHWFIFIQWMWEVLVDS